MISCLQFFSAHGGPALCLLGICFTDCNRDLTIGLFTLGVTLQGALYTGFFVNPLDIAPNYAGNIYFFKHE
jgi:ACS family sodium-dependent inorganic phosphate cotransporter